MCHGNKVHSLAQHITKNIFSVNMTFAINVINLGSFSKNFKIQTHTSFWQIVLPFISASSGQKLTLIIMSFIVTGQFLIMSNIPFLENHAMMGAVTFLKSPGLNSLLKNICICILHTVCRQRLYALPKYCQPCLGQDKVDLLSKGGSLQLHFLNCSCCKSL